jgi:hypothetical protein
MVSYLATAIGPALGAVARLFNMGEGELAP